MNPNQSPNLCPKACRGAGPSPRPTACPSLRPSLPAKRKNSRESDRSINPSPPPVLTPSLGSQPRSTEWLFKKNRSDFFISRGTEDKDQHGFFDIYTDLLSAPGALANPHACTGIDGGVHEYLEAFSQVCTPGSTEQITPQDTKFDHCPHHPMAKSGIKEDTYFLYLEEVAEGYVYTATKYAENATDFCQTNNSMGERKIVEFANSGPVQVLINKTHPYLFCC